MERALPAIAVNYKALEMGKACKVLGVFIQNNYKWDLLVLRQRRSTIWLAANPPIRFASSTAVPRGTPPFPTAVRKNRALRVVFPTLHYREALEICGSTTLHARRQELCAKTITKLKVLESHHHFFPPTRARAHARSLRFSDIPSLMKRLSTTSVW